MGVIGGGFLGRWVGGLGRCVVAPSGSERVAAMEWMPCLVRSKTPGGGIRIGVGHEVVDDYLEFLAARCRPNTVLAAGFDLKVFFTTVPKDPTEVTTGDVLGFITAQRAVGDPTVVRLSDGGRGCRRARSSGGCRRCRACSRSWSQRSSTLTCSSLPPKRSGNDRPGAGGRCGRVAGAGSAEAP